MGPEFALAALKTTAYVAAAKAGRAYLKRYAADAAKRTSVQPTGLRYWEPRILGCLAVVAWLVALVSALGVVLPRAYTARSNVPATQAAAFAKLLSYKARALRVAVIAFGMGLLCLGIVLVIALVTTR